MDSHAQEKPVDPPAPRRQRAQPGKFPVLQKVVMEPVPGRHGRFTHDEQPVEDMITLISSHVHPVDEATNMNYRDPVEFMELVRRFVYMMMAKKLSVSMSDDQNAQFFGYLKGVMDAPVSGPSSLVHLFDNFGSFENEKCKFEMIGQPVLAFSYFARAVQPAVADRRTALYVNVRWPNYREILMDFLTSSVNAWADASPPAQFEFPGGQVVEMSVPKLSQGFAGFTALVANVAKPASIARFLAVGSLLDAAGPDLMNPQVQAQFNAANVFFVDWNSQTITERISGYTINVENAVKLAFSNAMNWVPISVMKTRGSGGQILYKETESFFSGPFLLPPESIEMGWMFAGFNSFVTVDPTAAGLRPPMTTFQGMNRFVSGCVKKNT